MKKLIGATVFLAGAALVGSAFAADLPSRKAPVVAPPPMLMNWSGFYLGVNAGGTFGGSNGVQFTGTPLMREISILAPGAFANAAAAAASQNVAVGNNSGFIGGGQLGFNLQFSPFFVAGIEADIQGISGGRGGATQVVSVTPFGNPNNPVISIDQARKSLDYLGTVRGRIGVLVVPTLLVYGTGGLAYGGLRSAASITQTISGANGGAAGVGIGAASVSSNRLGFTAGGGLEWMFLPNWSAKVEYLYYDLGRVTYGVGAPTLNPGACITCTGFGMSSAAVIASTRFRGQIVRAGVNYHFNWSAPGAILTQF